MGVGVRKNQNNGPVTGALFFSSPRLALYTRFPLRAKRRVRLNLAPRGGGGLPYETDGDARRKF